MKKKLSILVLTIAMLFGMILLNVSNHVSAEGEVDYSNQVEVTNWDILDSHGQPLSTTNGAKPYAKYQYSAEWTLTPTGGAILHENDVFSFSLPINSIEGEWEISNSEWEVFKDEDNIILGKWRIYNKKIEVVLSENVEGKQTVSGKLMTGVEALFNEVTNGGIQTVTSGGLSKEILFLQHELIELKGKNDVKQAVTTSNSRIQWRVFLNREGAISLATQPWGTNFTIQNNTYFEDQLESSYGGGLSIIADCQIPFSLTEGKASISSMGLIITNRFTMINQSSGEDYNTFKARLKAFEYGVYKDTSGIETLIINFGNIGNNGLKYSNLRANFDFIVDNAIDGGYYAESSREELENYFETVYGDGNSINGDIAHFRIEFDEDYNKVIVDTEKINTAMITKNKIVANVTAKGILQGVSGSASAIEANKARAYLFDKDTVELLSGVAFKLQRKQIDNSWIDYTSWTGGVINDNGYVDTSILGIGTYRFVQQDVYSSDYDLSKSEGYDSALSTCVSEQFSIVAGDIEGKTVYMTNVKKKFSVTYQPGEYGTFATEIYNNITIHSDMPSFTGTITGVTGYHFTGWSPVVTNTVNKDEVYVAQWQPNSDTVYKVEHYQEQIDGTFKLVETNWGEGMTGEIITITPKSYEGYTYDNKIAGTIIFGEVNGDGSLVLRVYYTLDEDKGSATEPLPDQTTTTSDRTNIIGYVGVMMLSLLGGLYVIRKKINK